MTPLPWGLGLTAVVTGGLWAVWGPVAVLPGLSFGLLATGIQVVAALVARPVLGGAAPFDALVKRWAVGMGLRLGGVVLFAIAAGLAPERFPPLPTAFGYLGVLLPLLFLEIRLAR